MCPARAKRAHLYGIDPGTSEKKKSAGLLAVYYAYFDLQADQLVEKPKYCNWRCIELDKKIMELFDKAKDTESTILLSVDVPVVTPHEFVPKYIATKNAQYPFYVEPFSMRPCEHALSSKPRVIDESLKHEELTKLIGDLCGWEKPYKSPDNKPFTKCECNEGVSVKSFSQAPHQPLMSVFRKRLESYKKKIEFSTSPKEANELLGSHIYYLESHPAVTMGFWLKDNRFSSGLSKIPLYKGRLNAEEHEPGEGEKASEEDKEARSLAESIAVLANELHKIDCTKMKNDDELDAFVGLVNLLDLVNGNGDWFGTLASGYFLVPRLKLLGGKLFSDSWDTAEAKVREANKDQDAGSLSQLSIPLVQSGKGS